MGIFKLNGVDYMGGGGGGNTNYEELTQLEYDALTEEEKNNGTIYFITDTNSNQDSKFQPIIYSEEEREVGVWIDGKPLYQKTINTGSLVGNTTTEIDLSNLYIDNCIRSYGFTKTSNADGGWQININDITPGNINGSIRVYYSTSTSKLYVTLGRDVGNSYTTSYVTICYTKTTDSPGSGQWTPQGVPAVHYSTDEQVVGTWIDGSTVYEKVLTHAGGSYGEISIAHGISEGIDTLVSFNGSCSDNYGSGTTRYTIPDLRPDGNHIYLTGVEGTYVKINVPQVFNTRIVDITIVIRYTKTSSQGGN